MEINGIDTINGGRGADFIGGGESGDLLTGGAAKDIFDYNGIGESSFGAGRDVITDFTVDPAAGAAFVDRMDFDSFDAQGSTPGDQHFDFIGGANFSAEGQIRAVQAGANTSVLINIDGSNGAEMEIVLQNFTAANLGDEDFRRPGLRRDVSVDDDAPDRFACMHEVEGVVDLAPAASCG